MGFGKDNKGVIIRERFTHSLGALVDGDVEITAKTLAITEDFRIIKTELSATIELTADAGAHGSVFGIANGVLTAAQIEACLELNGPSGPSARPAAEAAERFCKTLGVFQNPSGGLECSLIGVDGGPLIRETIRWTFTDTDQWVFWVYNNTGVTMQTGNIVNVLATHYGVWLI